MERALSVDGARVVPVAWAPALPAACVPQAASVSGAISGSARVAIRLRGDQCPAWAWLRVEVWATVAVTSRPVRAGEPLGPAVVTEEREVRAGHAPTVPAPDAVAARDLRRGTVIESTHVAGATLPAGEPVKVVVITGALAVEMQGRAVPCGSRRTCVVLPSGRHVEGRLENGRLLVEVP
jgi:flagella basal body P-ring formation protein FlgA